MEGEYIGIDHQAHPEFDQTISAKFARRQIITDILDLQPETIAPVDLLISMTSLEHFEDDAAALAIARKTLAPDSGELHLIHAEDGLRLWETHSWRQYAPACVRGLCPEAKIYRIGGAASGIIHRRCITDSNRCSKQGVVECQSVLRDLAIERIVFGNRCRYSMARSRLYEVV